MRPTLNEQGSLPHPNISVGKCRRHTCFFVVLSAKDHATDGGYKVVAAGPYAIQQITDLSRRRIELPHVQHAN